MRWVKRCVKLLVLAGVVVGSALHLDAGRHPQAAAAYTLRVSIYDSDAKLVPGDAAGTAFWGFAPAHFVVTRGDPILFVNPAGNNVFHTVTSISWRGALYQRELTSGASFNSSPTEEERLNPGTSWILDTSDLAPGHYLFYCQPHPWMAGAFFVMARPQ